MAQQPEVQRRLARRRFAEATQRGAIKVWLKTLRRDRVALVETEARRIVAMTEPAPEAMLRRLGEAPQFRAKVELVFQRDSLARSLWAYLRATSLMEAAERAMQVRVYRDHGKLYEAWSVGASIPLTADGVDEGALATEIAARLQHEDDCKVEAVDLPPEEGESREVLLAVTFFGAYASQRTVRPDKTTDLIYFRPPDELLLVYAPARQRIETGDLTPVERVQKLPTLLALYDLRDDKVSGRTLDDLGADADQLTRAGFLTRTGWSDVILFEDEELGEVIHDVERDESSGHATLSLSWVPRGVEPARSPRPRNGRARRRCCPTCV